MVVAKELFTNTAMGIVAQPSDLIGVFEQGGESVPEGVKVSGVVEQDSRVGSHLIDDPAYP